MASTQESPGASRPPAQGVRLSTESNLMREISFEEAEAVSGGNPWLILGIVMTAIAISDGVEDFIDGYNDARDSR